jgi:hypothetical protein
MVGLCPQNKAQLCRKFSEEYCSTFFRGLDSARLWGESSHKCECGGLDKLWVGDEHGDEG